ncbi:T9SS type B sorting domain-containing protein [Flavobacterium wongokense]|uniref:T9SS type B sorting domain-containing protein n=1 Tax=Flavobacterium wongokense TaxID=2910674 RepID=UPI001F1BDCF4|nr:T9SS type B sorting domain-containing protein [Flavobacterium sp. WG47]MCF6133227.1 T9SS type B sorting domain-containing protein [Flavobacterium sp. WG47]
MKRWIKYIRILLVCVGFTTLAYAQPANDACGSATPITVGNGSCNSILYTNVAATSVGDPAIPACWNPASLSHTVWFSFVATTADIEISTNFGGTLANTQLAVYSGTCGSLTQIGCQENINTGGGLLHTDVILHGLTIGNTYYLLVDGNGATTGTFGICAQQTLPVGPPLPTQDCTGAQTLCGLASISVPDGPGGVGSTTEAPSCFGAPGERSSNWYSFTAATGGLLAFAITPTSVIDYDFAVYNTTNSCPGTELICNWDPATGAAGTTGLGCAGIQCEATLNVTAGQTYTILVDRYTAASTAGFTMNFTGTTATFASPNPSFTATTVCEGTPTQFTNTTNGNFTYNWNFGDGFTSQLENPSHTFATPGGHSVSLLVTAVPGGCQNIVNQIVQVTPIPTVDAGIGGTVCSGSCITLNGSTNATGSIGPVAFSNISSYPIPDGSTTGVLSPITVSGISPTTINATSIASVCLNIRHTFDGDLDIYLQCPDGTFLELSTDNGGIGQDYANTCFSPTAVTPITSGTDPFTGTFLPEQPFSVLNGCNVNGNWRLFVQDDAALDTGDIRDWTITFNNNLPPFTWSPSATMTNSTTLSPSACPTVATTYTLTANSGVGCSATDTVTVNVTTPLVPTINCGITTSSSIQYNWLAVTGATSYTVSYQVGALPIVNIGNVGNVLTYSVTGLPAGTNVTITVTPVGGAGTCFAANTRTCATTACVAPAIPTISTTAPTCAADGFTTITNYNAANTYTFSPVGPTAGAGGTITGATLGTAYTVTATSSGCTSAASTGFTNIIRLTTPAVPTVSTTAPSCAADGFTTITNYNAANTYTFSPVGPTAGAGGTITGATLGTAYTITATSSGCTSAASAGFTNLIMLTTPAVPTVSTTAPTCAADGFTTITNYNAANTYTFSPVGPTAGAGGTITGATLGTAYTVTATSGGCTSVASAGFTNVIRLTTPAVPTVSTTAPTCAADGFTTITNYNAANTYTFSPLGPTAGVGGTITGATLGTAYTVTATSGGCTSAASAGFTNVVRLTTPAVPTVSTTAPTCAADGFTTITNYNAANTYTFSPLGPTAGAGGTITGATLGTAYTITATSGACTSAASAGFTNVIRLTTPAVPTVSTTAPSCAADGFTTITNYNAAHTYTFSPVGPTAGAGGTITGATLGTAYTITATSGGCTSAASAGFTNLIMLVTPAVPTVSTTAPTCAADGFTTITNYNAAHTYTFSPAGPTAGAGGTITGATLGTAYTVTATSGSCTSAPSVAFTNLITLTTQPVPITSTTAPSCAADGFTTITNYNAAITYTFSPVGPTASAGGTITGAVIGTAYTITATSGGCTSAASPAFTNLIMLTTPAVPTVSTTAPTCTADGFTTITNYNAANTYTFSPVGPTAGPGGAITGAVIGTAYTITATSGGCTSAVSSAFTNIIMLATPAVPTTNTTAPTCAADGFTTITNYNAANTYTFSPLGPTAGAGGTITGAVIGTAYTITATSGVCTSAASAGFTNLIMLVTPAVPTINTTPPTCIADGFSTIINYNAANTYTFSPAGPTVGAGGTITGATLGTAYTITATNGGCTSASSAAFTNLIQLANLPTPLLTTNLPTCAADGFTIITNYNPAFTYTFSPLGPTAGAGGTITGAVIGTAYTVIATQSICTSGTSLPFTNGAMLITPAVPNVSTTAPTCAADGFTTITNYNAANTYTFSPVGPTAGTGGTITGAVIGTAYTITATSGGCTSAASTGFTNLIMLTTPAVPTVSTTAPSCAADGFTTITNYNTANTYTFSPVGPTAGAGGTINGAVIGTAYTITATNGGCTSAASAGFTNVIRLTTPAVPTVSTTAPTCAADGFTTITNYNAANTYTFSPVGPTAGAGGTITGATLGTAYTITATSGGCTSAASAGFTNLVMLPTPAVPTVSTTAPTCAADGFTTITNYNASNTYTFSPVGPNAGAAGTITGATLGTAYTITATSGGCTSAASAGFTNVIRLTTPAVPTVSTTAPTCAADGFTTITNYNAANTYTFSPVGPTAGAGGTITGAALGTAYTITATNGGCTSAASAGFTNLIMLTTPAVPTVSTTAPTCAADGFTTITNYNAAHTYTFSPTGPTAGAGGTMNGAVIGTAYTITATNGGCTSAPSSAFTNVIMLPTPAVPTVSTTAPTCVADGFTTITNYNATITYIFSPVGPTAGAGGTITGAVIGTAYNITATSGGCTSTASSAFTNLLMLPTPAVPTLNTTPPACFTDGFTSITNYNTANSYTFSPVGPTAGTGGTISGAVVGTAYTVTSTNGGCTSASAAFTNAPLLFNVNTASPSPLHYCDPNNDGFGTFDLTQVIPTIIGGNPYVVTFHETPTDATIGGTTIPTPASYDNIDVNTQTIYIRVTSNATGCFAIIPMQLIVDPTPEAIEPNDYHVCDDNTDGIASFNLTSVISEVLGTINPATHTISFYTDLPDAQSETSPIINLNNFPSSGQTIWIRVEDIATGCSDIVTLELIVDPLPLATQPNYPQYSLCDMTLPLAHEEFDLGSRINSILLGQTGMNVTFHFSQADASNDVNPLPLLYTNVDPFVQTIWIRIENDITGCFTLSTIDIRVEPLPTPIPPAQAYSICDNNQDGFGTFNLNSLTNDILQGANYTITYHETFDDAQLGNNPLSSPYDNVTPFTQFIYALAVDNINGCRSVIPIELEVKPQPMTPFNVPDLVQCDEDNFPQNGSMFFNLTQNNAAVLSIQPGAPTDYTVTYHISQPDAISGNFPIIQATNYVGTNHQIIWVRVEDNATGCFSTGSFELLINAPLVLPIPTPLSVCDDDAIDNNQFTQFDLTIKNNEITGSQANMIVTYYPGYPVTASSVAIPNPTAYTNIIPAVQTLGVMVTTPDGCRSYTSLDIRVLPIPVPNPNPITPLPPQCDVNNTGDMMEVFDLTVNASTIINGDPTLTLHYYPSQPDAEAGTNEILIPNAALVGQNVWIRVENNRVDYQGNNCFVLVEQPLTVNPLPATLPAAVVQNCDDDADGQATFDLTVSTAAFYAASNVTVTYYTSAANAQSGTGSIANPTAYLNISNPQIIYIRVVDNVTGCVNFNGQFTITVNPKPTATAPAVFETCDTDGTNDGFFALDLSSYINGIIGAQTGVTVTFYNTAADANNETSPITDLVNYQTYTHTIYIRVENDATGCFVIVPFANTVEELAEPHVTAPTDVICVEYGTNILLSGVTLDSGITNPNYTFEWFEATNPTVALGNGSTYPITTVAPGSYFVVATSTNPPLLGCVSDRSNTYTVTQSGPPQFSTPPYTITNAFDANQIITVNVVGHGIYEYSMDDGPFQSSNIFEHVPLGIHQITIRDARGITSCGSLFIDEVQTIDYPHYFTPNGDGINDTWNVRGLDQLNARLYIFDRYGKLLKQLSTSSDSPGWDGTLNGYLLPSTDYWFKIEFLEQSQMKEFKAHFSLKR